VKGTSFFFLATVFAVTFEKVNWGFAGTVSIADILAVMFLILFALERLATADGRAPKTAVVALAFALAFLVVDLIGFFNLHTNAGEAQFAKGMIKFAIHFLFLVAGISFVVRGGQQLYWRTLAAFVGGLVVNSIYGVLQLLAAQAGANLDSALLSPLTGGASSINIYGAVSGQSVYRPNALTGDPNHLGIMLIVPLLVLLPIYLRVERGNRLRRPLVATLVFLFLVELATLSRSGLVGFAVGLLVLAVPYRHKLFSRQLLEPLAAALAVVAIVVLSRLSFFETVIKSRVQTGGSSTSAHFGVYSFIPKILAVHPLFGLGYNNFSVYYQAVTGKTNWGPHSFYVALIVETGLVGTAVFVLFLWYVFARLGAARAVGRALAAAGDPLSARVRPLAWGLTAALAGTIAANFFYLTMTFYYFFVVVVLALAAPLVFSKRRRA
jgi:hypothetical protein